MSTEKQRATPMKRGKPVRVQRVLGARTKAILNAYSDICLILSPLAHEQRVRVVKAVAISLGQ